MCRWLAYSGDPVPLENLIVRPKHSLIDQSMNARMGAYPTNGDGIGVGWYGRNNEPGVYHSVLPAWNDRNLQELAHHIESPLYMAHIRHSTGTPVQSTNCHPFRYANWMMVHNGLIRGFEAVRRELTIAVDPRFSAHMRGNTDSERIFYLALTFGLQQDPLTAVSRAIGLIEKAAHDAGTEHPIQMTLGFTDSNKLYAFRYSSEGDSRSLFVSESVETLQKLHPDKLRVRELSPHARAVVSEPVADLPGVWQPVDDATMLIVENGEVTSTPFAPEAP
jgi:glutamine amidotransferase